MRARAFLVLSLVCALACHDHEAEAAIGTKANLGVIRTALANYRKDQGQYPHSLDELVPKYLPRIPADPLTNKADWGVTTEESVQPSADFQSTTTAEAPRPVIVDVHSNAPGADRNGVPYANY